MIRLPGGYVLPGGLLPGRRRGRLQSRPVNRAVSPVLVLRRRRRKEQPQLERGHCAETGVPVRPLPVSPAHSYFHYTLLLGTVGLAQQDILLLGFGNAERFLTDNLVALAGHWRLDIIVVEQVYELA